MSFLCLLIIKLARYSVPLCSVSSGGSSLIIIIIIIKETAKKKVPFGHFALKISEENCKMPLHIFSPTATLCPPATRYKQEHKQLFPLSVPAVLCRK